MAQSRTWHRVKHVANYSNFAILLNESQVETLMNEQPNASHLISRLTSLARWSGMPRRQLKLGQLQRNLAKAAELMRYGEPTVPSGTEESADATSHGEPPDDAATVLLLILDVLLAAQANRTSVVPGTQKTKGLSVIQKVKPVTPETR